MGRGAWLQAVLAATFVSCTQPPAAEADAETVEPTTATESEPVTYVNRVWSVVDRSDGAAGGSLYVFLSDGTLVISSPNARPALGQWRAEGDGIVMIEEGIEYRVEILDVEADDFRIRSHHPGGALEIRFRRAD